MASKTGGSLFVTYTRAMFFFQIVLPFFAGIMARIQDQGLSLKRKDLERVQRILLLPNLPLELAFKEVNRLIIKHLLMSQRKLGVIIAANTLLSLPPED
jgi:fructose-specific phosphotransferase system IIC component